MHVPDRPLDPPEGEELPEDEFRCHLCGERQMNEDLGYTRILCKRPQMVVEICDRCAKAEESRHVAPLLDPLIEGVLSRFYPGLFGSL